MVQDPVREFRGVYQAELRDDGLLLRRRDKDLALLPRESPATHLERNRVRLPVGRRDLDLAVTPSGLYAGRLARDLVAFWNGRHAIPQAADYRLPRGLRLLAWLPLGVGILAAVAGGLIGGLVGGGLAGALFQANLAIANREDWPIRFRVALAGTLALAGYALVVLAIVGLLWLVGPRTGHSPLTNQPVRPEPPAIAARPTQTTPTASALGVPEDPAGDCRISVTGPSAVFEVPGTMHDLSFAPGRALNAPRILSEREGDFEASVEVRWSGPPSDPPAPGGTIAFHGAGLLVWSSDGSSLIRLEQAGFVRDGRLQIYVLFEHLNQRGFSLEHDGTCGAGPLQLRMIRNGPMIRGEFSTDGRNWQTLPPHTLGPGKVRVGVAAINTAARPLRVEFSGYALTPR